jgi:DNA-binding transcriptional LysR family regulator
MDHLRSIEVFTRVAEAGSFVAAARALRLPPATVTTAV